jgi:hypothetical protein
MRHRLVRVLSVVGASVALALSASPICARTARECNGAYAADWRAIKASGQTKAAYFASCRTQRAAPAVEPPAPPADPMAPKPIMRP